MAARTKRAKTWGRAEGIIGTVLALIMSGWLGFGKAGWIGTALCLGLPGFIVAEYGYRSVIITKYDQFSLTVRWKKREYAEQFRAVNKAAAMGTLPSD